MTYLYLLPFKDGVHFKLGVSTSLENRIKQHSNNFDLDLEKALIVYSKKSIFTLSLEQELLLTLEDAGYSSYYNGYTEIRLMKDFEKALDYIKSKSDFLGFKITDYNNPEFEIKKVKNRLVNRNRITDKHTIVLIRAIKRLKVQKSEIANWLRITESEYYEIEKKGFDSNVKRDIIKLLSDKLYNIKYVGDKIDLMQSLLNILEEMNRDS